jgi:hypothetical protein
VFRTIQIQAVLFTSEVHFRGTRFMSHFLSSKKWGDLFNGEPTSFEPHTIIGMPVIGFPRAILKSEDSLIRLFVSTERVDFIRNVADESDVDVAGHVETAIELFAEYQEQMSGKADRAAVILLRASENEEPARTISSHFCREKWLDGPMNRARDFEIAAMKQYQMAGTIEVNSWFRCRSGQMVKTDQSKVEQKAILVEQDLNTTIDRANSLGLSQDEIREFFALAPNELDVIFGLYFRDQ